MSAVGVDQPLRYKGFSVEIKDATTGADTDASWESLSASESISDSAPGHDEAARKVFTEIVLRGPLTVTRKGLLDWLNDTFHCRNPFRTVTITTIPVEPKEAAETVVFENAFVTRYTVPPLSAACAGSLAEEVRFGFRRAVRQRRP